MPTPIHRESNEPRFAMPFSIDDATRFAMPSSADDDLRVVMPSAADEDLRGAMPSADEGLRRAMSSAADDVMRVAKPSNFADDDLRFAIPSFADDEIRAWDVRRPGELHRELALEPDAAARLRAEASADGTSPSVALTVKLEAALAVERLRGFGVPDPIALLDEIAAAQRPVHALSTAEADYARSLTLDRFGGHEPDLTVPVRLHSRVQTHDVEALLGVVGLCPAIRWELAALRAGATIGEWAALSALAGATA